LADILQSSVAISIKYIWHQRHSQSWTPCEHSWSFISVAPITSLAYWWDLVRCEFWNNYSTLYKPTRLLYCF